MSEVSLPAESPFLKLGAEPAAEEPAPDPATAAEGAAEPAEAEKPEGLFSDAPPEKRKGGTLAARFQKLTTDRKNALEEAAKLRSDVDRLNAELADARPFRDVVQKRYGKFKDPVAAVDQDAQWMDDLESLKHLPEAQKTIQAIEAKRKGETIVEPTRVREEKPVAAPADSASETKADKVLKRLAGDLVNATLAEAGVRTWARDLVRNAILADPAVDLSELDADQAIAWSREFFEGRGMTAARVLEAVQDKPRRPGTGRSSRSAATTNRRSRTPRRSRSLGPCPPGTQRIEPPSGGRSWSRCPQEP